MVDVIYNNPWLIEPEYGKKLLEAYRGYKDKDMLAYDGYAVPKAEEGQDELIASTSRWNPRIVNGVGIIPINGIIMRYANNINFMCGNGTATGLVHRQVKEFLEDSDVKAILFDIDSGGGEATGLYDLTDTIYNGRDIKPIYSFVSGTACASAAYWIASATSKIYANQTAMVGSIGVVSAYRKEEDETTIEFVSAQSPKKRLSPESDKGKVAIQKRVNQYADIFINRVALFRGLEPEAVIKGGDYGNVLIAEDALNNGLIDAIGNIDLVINDLLKESSMNDNETKQEGLSPVSEVAAATAAAMDTGDTVLAEKAVSVPAVPLNVNLAASQPQKPDEVLMLGDVQVSRSVLGDKVFNALLEQQKDLQEKELAVAKQHFAMQAEKDYPCVAGTPEEKGAFLMAVQSMPVAEKAFALKLMSIANSTTAAMMNQIASNVVTSSAGDVFTDNKEEEYKAMVDKEIEQIMRSNPNISAAKARALAHQKLGD